MSNIGSMQKEIKSLKNQLRNYEKMYERQVNPPVSIVHVDFKEKYEEAKRELDSFQKIMIPGLYRKCKR